MQNDITPRQKSIVEYIAETIESEGFPPTLQAVSYTHLTLPTIYSV